MELHVIVSRVTVNARQAGKASIVRKENVPKDFMAKNATINVNVKMATLNHVIPSMDRVDACQAGVVRHAIVHVHTSLMEINAIRSVIVEITLSACLRTELVFARLVTRAINVKKNAPKELTVKIVLRGVNARMELIVRKKLDR
jgi:hypothetical protein